MTKTRKTKWILAAAVAAVPMLAGALPSAMAQYRSQNDGRARDANNRVGSNGYNDGGGGNGGRVNSQVTGNQVITGNVTRGQEFRGAVPYGESRAFRGPTAGSATDRFVRDSSGSAARSVPSESGYTPQAFYGQSRAVAPPPGSVPLGASGGFVEDPTAAGNFNVTRFSNGFASTYDVGYNPYSTGQGFVPGANGPKALGSRVLPAPSDPQTQEQTIFLASPLSGVRNLTQGEAFEYFNQRSPADRAAEIGGGLTDRFGTDLGTALRIRMELDASVVGPKPTPQQGPNGQPSQPQQQEPNSQQLSPGPLTAQPLGKPLPQPLEAPASTALPAATPLPNSPSDAGGDAGAGGDVPRPRLAAPVQQSTQYNELHQRLKRYEAELTPTSTPPPAGGVRLPPPPRPAPGGTGLPPLPPPGGGGAAPVPRPPAGGGTTTRPAGGAAGAALPAPRGEPVMIKTLATGVRSPTLARLLQQAEDLMKKGKFADALDLYDRAEQGAPNNSLIFLGKANAELGASSYRTAEAHIRQAFAGDRALLMGRYDLNSFIGPERLQILVKDLKELSAANPNEAMSPFLLGYIYYNVADTAQASAQLAEAEKRAGGRDPVIDLMRQHWSLKGGTTQPMNK